MKITREKIATDLIFPLWISIDQQYKIDYKSTIWDQFENVIRAASYTDSLNVFLTNFKRRLPINILSKDIKDILSIVDSGEDDEILDLLRNETIYLVMHTRLINQERKEKWRHIH